MSDNTNLSGVEDTLFIPLAARVDASIKFPEFFYDFYINDAKEFAENAGVELLKLSPFYDDARSMLKKKLGLYSRIAMKVADEKGRTKILHIKF